jgi:hypothetical protein
MSTVTTICLAHCRKSFLIDVDLLHLVNYPQLLTSSYGRFHTLISSLKTGLSKVAGDKKKTRSGLNYSSGHLFKQKYESSVPIRPWPWHRQDAALFPFGALSRRMNVVVKRIASKCPQELCRNKLARVQSHLKLWKLPQNRENNLNVSSLLFRHKSTLITFQLTS